MNKQIISYIIVVIVLLLNSNSVETKEVNYPYPTFSTTIGTGLNGGSKEFFDYFIKNVRLNLEPVNNEFIVSPIVGVAVKLEMPDKYRLCLLVDYFIANFHQAYPQNINGIKRSIFDEYDLSSLPVFVTFEYLPFSTQFKSYVGIGFGFSFDWLKWKEFVTSSYIDDKRVGGLLHNEALINPCLTLYTGLELGFDTWWRDSFLAGLIIEPRLNWYFRKAKVFKKAADQLENPKNIDNSFTILPSYICLNIGLCFNLNKLK